MPKHQGLYRPKYKDPKTGEIRESKNWWIRYTCRGCEKHPRGGRHWESTGTESITAGKRKREALVGTAAKGQFLLSRPEKTTVDDILQMVSTDYSIKGRKTADSVERRIRLHLKPFFGGRPAITVSMADLSEFIKSRLEDPNNAASPAEINRELALLRRGFTLAMKAGRLYNRPYFELLPERNARKGFVTDSQFRLLIDNMPQDVGAAITFLNETGWREIEALSREWRHIDFSVGKVILERDENKTEEPRIFPFTETLKDLLKSQRIKANKIQREKNIFCRYVFFCEETGEPLFQGIPPRPTDYFRRSWEAACKAGKVIATVHDFRRTAARRLIQSGIDEQTAMKLLGHKTTAIFRRYRITTEQDLFDAANKLNAGKKGKVKGK